MAKVRALNSLGGGLFSDENVDGVNAAKVKTVPDTPTSAPIRVEAQTTTTKIYVEMPQVVDNSDKAGGAVITSYNLEWNEGSGTTFKEVAGATSDNLNRIVSVTTTPGTTYTFRFKVRNIFGWSSGFSPTSTVLSAKAPATPGVAVTSISGLHVKIDWTAPSSNAATITSYRVEIKAKDNSFKQETIACDGSKSTIISATECLIPLTTLIGSNFLLERGNLVVARVTATNIIGTSLPSPLNTTGALIQTKPLAPSPPTRGSASNHA